MALNSLPGLSLVEPLSEAKQTPLLQPPGAAFDPQRKCRDPSFDDFVGQRKQHRRHTVRPSAVAVFEIDDKFKLGRCSHRLSLRPKAV
jgi:hypothetical protein